MRQTFDETTDPSFGPKHVPLIRAAMKAQGLDGFLVPHEVANLEGPGVDLIADLQGVAAVDEDRRLVGQDHRGPGRAREAGRPAEPVVGLGQILVLVLVLVRDQEAVQPLRLHGRADQGDVLGAEGRIGGFIEGLMHGRNLVAAVARRQPSRRVCAGRRGSRAPPGRR